MDVNQIYHVCTGLCEFCFSTSTVVGLFALLCLFGAPVLAPVKITVQTDFTETLILPCDQGKECMKRCVVGSHV